MHVTYRQLQKILSNIENDKLDDFVVVEVLTDEIREDGEYYHLDIDIESNNLIVDTY